MSRDRHITVAFVFKRGNLPIALVRPLLMVLIAIAWLLKFLKRRSIWVFVRSRLGFGVFILAVVALGWIKG